MPPSKYGTPSTTYGSQATGTADEALMMSKSSKRTRDLSKYLVEPSSALQATTVNPVGLASNAAKSNGFSPS